MDYRAAPGAPFNSALNQGLSHKQINEALALVHAHHEEIINAWHSHFGN
jgi:hypothetical protein